MKNKLLIYDDNCPLCQWYSAQFVRFGFLNKAGKLPFSSLEEKYLQRIDFNKSRNEIPLLDTETGKVTYGIDALLEILGSKIPFIKTIGHIQPIYWFLSKLYKFVSFNRKVIVAVKCGTGAIDCAPDFNYFYRGLFMFLFLITNTLLLFPFHKLILSPLPFYHISIWQLQAGHLALVTMNCLLSLHFKWQKMFDYLGQVNMLALLTNLFLLPLFVLVKTFGAYPLFITIWLIAVSLFIFKEYFRRMEFAGIIPNNKWIASFNIAGMTGFVLFLFS
ncbi:MAG: DUF393 domain-containing protein [Sphingobacteriales bacterium]|nr:DUF393 domain-containing protein [Sphingobacteriales bacterium]